MKSAFAALVLALSATTAFAQDVIIEPPIDWDGRPHRRGWAPIDMTDYSIEVKVKDQVATVSLSSTFKNPNPFQAEGTYFMSLPANASVNDFTMSAGGKKMEAKLHDAAEARQIYQSFVRRYIDPGLLELVGTQLLKASIFPIPPGGTMSIDVSYQVMLESRDDLVSMVLPFARHLTDASPIGRAKAVVEIESALPIKNVYSPSHAMDVAKKDDHHVSATFDATRVEDKKDIALYYSTGKDPVGLSLITFRDKNDDGFFALLASPQVEVDTRHILPKDIVFVFDRSGSMKGDKVRQGKDALRYCIDHLNDGDRFNIIDFGTDVTSFADALNDADETNRNRARRYIDNIQATGATNIDEALETAFKMLKEDPERVRMIFFASDGLPTQGERNLEKLAAKVGGANKAGVRLFAFGVGTDVNTAFLDKIAGDSNGAKDYVLPEEDIKAKVSGLYARTSAPMLTDVSLAFGDVKIRDFYPRRLPDVYRGDQVVLFGRYSGSGPVVVTLKGKAGKDERTFRLETTLPDDDRAASYLPRLWAARKIAALTDQYRLGGTPDKEVVDEVVELAKKYGIVTPWTSFLIVEDGAVAPPAPAEMLRRMEDLQDRAKASGGAGGHEESRKAIGESKELERSQAESAVDALDKYADAHFAGRVRGGKGVTDMRVVEGKVFFLRDGVWMDSAYQKKADEKPVDVEFGSDAYFKLADQKAAFAKWFSLGDAVLVVVDGTIYRVMPAKAEEKKP